jgi:hypothetical protein
MIQAIAKTKFNTLILHDISNPNPVPATKDALGQHPAKKLFSWQKINTLTFY